MMLNIIIKTRHQPKSFDDRYPLTWRIEPRIKFINIRFYSITSTCNYNLLIIWLIFACASLEQGEHIDSCYYDNSYYSKRFYISRIISRVSNMEWERNSSMFSFACRPCGVAILLGTSSSSSSLSFYFISSSSPYVICCTTHNL